MLSIFFLKEFIADERESQEAWENIPEEDLLDLSKREWKSIKLKPFQTDDQCPEVVPGSEEDRQNQELGNLLLKQNKFPPVCFAIKTDILLVLHY